MKIIYYLTILLFCGLVKSESLLNKLCQDCASTCVQKELIGSASGSPLSLVFNFGKTLFQTYIDNSGECFTNCCSHKEDQCDSVILDNYNKCKEDSKTQYKKAAFECKGTDSSCLAEFIGDHKTELAKCEEIIDCCAYTEYMNKQSTNPQKINNLCS
jgi:hypothetical protein